MPTSVHEFKASAITGEEISLDQYKGKALLIVNTASACGYTPQYAGLEALHKKYQERGFAVLGFPCNQFGRQEPGTEAQIQAFCQKNYGVTFPMFAKVDVNGDRAHPLFDYLKKSLPGILNTEPIKWNFTKFLVDRNGKPIERFAPATPPESIQKAVESVL